MKTNRDSYDKISDEKLQYDLKIQAAKTASFFKKVMGV